MKPFGVLVLVLVAVGGLFFAINMLGGADDPVKPIETISPAGPSGTTEPGEGGGNLAVAGGGEREAAAPIASESERIDSAPADGENFGNSVRGTVINVQQQPIADATVVLTRGGIQGVLFANDNPDRSQDRTVKADAQGRYTFFNVTPWDGYSIEATAPGYCQGAVAGIVIVATGNVTPPPIVLREGATLQGRVTDTAGNPVPEAELHLEGLFSTVDGAKSPGSLVAFSDADGQYQIPNVPPGNRRLNISAEGYANQLKSGLVFRGEEPLLMDVTLEVAEMICGKVIDKRGQPIEDAKVLALSYSNSNRQCRDSVQTDANGEFCLTRIAGGKYTIAVTADRFRAGHENRVPTGGGNLIIELDDQGIVNGRVVAGDGPPPTPFTVQLRRTHPGTEITSLVGEKFSFESEDGSFAMECTTSGTYRVEASAPGYAPSFSEEFRFTLGQPMNGVVVHLTKGGSISGRVVDGQGNPVPRPHVTTHDNTWSNSLFDRALGDQFPTNATSQAVNGGAGGRFELTSLRGETYQLRFRAAGYCEATLKDIVVSEGIDNNIGDVKLLKGGEVTGSVIDPAGKPVLGTTVRLDPDGPESSGLNYATQSGADGKYSFVNVYPGSYKLRALSASGGEDPFIQTITGGMENAQIVKVKDGESLRFELRVGN